MERTSPLTPLPSADQRIPSHRAMRLAGMPRGNWALLVDRIRMYKGQPQLYGSQLKKDPSSGEFRFHDIEDEANVNQRRAEVGLEPIEDYAARFGFKYQPPKQ